MPVADMARTTNKLQALIRATASKNETAFEQLVLLTANTIYNVNVTILTDPKLARVALLQTYRCLWAEAPNLDVERTNLHQWMIAIARRVSLTVLSVNARASNQPICDFDESSRMPMVLTEDYLKLHKCLEQLPEGQGALIRCVYLHGFHYKFLARATGQSVEAIRAWMRAGLHLLKEGGLRG